MTSAFAGREEPAVHGHVYLRGVALVAYTMQMDDVAKHLMLAKSEVGIYADESRKRMVLQYDYDRDPPNDYPNPHLQVGGHSGPLTEMCEKVRTPSKVVGQLHLPVGGRRFRPTLEDVVEFLIIEGLADGHPGWRAAADEHRNEWLEIQLKAAVRRYDGWAVEAFTDLNYDVKPPPDPSAEGPVASAAVTIAEDRQQLAETIKRHLEIEDKILKALCSVELPPPDEFKALVREQAEVSRRINELCERLFT